VSVKINTTPTIAVDVRSSLKKLEGINFYEIFIIISTRKNNNNNLLWVKLNEKSFFVYFY